MLKTYEYAFAAGILGVGLIVLFLVGYRTGYHHVEVEFNTYKAKQQHLVEQMAIKAKEREIENDKRTTEVAHSYEDRLARVNAALRLRHAKPRRRASVPAAAECPSGFNAHGTAASAVAKNRRFYDAAVKTELMLEAWQNWATRQHIPVQ
jgi:hypothetical protein